MIDVKDIRKLYDIFKGDEIESVEIQNGDDRLSFSMGNLQPVGEINQENNTGTKKSAAKKSGKSAKESDTLEPAASMPVQEINAVSEESKQLEIFELKSGWVGFFTRMNPKTGESYIKLRDVIKKDDLVGHVRVLGVLQDLKSEVEGKVKEILVEEGQPIEYGQPVMRFELQ